MAALPLLFTPLALRDLTLRNRVVVAPMHQYAAREGFPTDWHLVNAGRYAAGGAGLVMMESTKVERRGCGTLVGIASVAGIRGMPGHGAYCASKAAVISYCESLRGELRPQGVKVVVLSPGYIATPLTRRNRYPMPFLMPAADFADRAVRAIAAGTPHRIIPWPMALVAALLRVLPAAWLDRLLAGRPRKQRQGEA